MRTVRLIALLTLLAAAAAADYVYMQGGATLYGVVVAESDLVLRIALAEGGYVTVSRSNVSGVMRHSEERRAEIMAARPPDEPPAAAETPRPEEQAEEEAEPAPPGPVIEAPPIDPTALPFDVGDPASMAIDALGDGYAIEVGLLGEDDVYEIHVAPDGRWAIFRYGAKLHSRPRQRRLRTGRVYSSDSAFIDPVDVWVSHAAVSLRTYSGVGGLDEALAAAYDKEQVMPQEVTGVKAEVRLTTRCYELKYPELGVVLALDRYGRALDAIVLSAPCAYTVAGLGIGDEEDSILDLMGAPSRVQASGRGQIWTYPELGSLRMVSGVVDEITVEGDVGDWWVPPLPPELGEDLWKQ